MNAQRRKPENNPPIAAHITGRRKRQPVDGTQSATALPVSGAVEKECASMAEDLAYFRAACHRSVEPGAVRKDDIESAQAEIAAVLCSRRMP